MRRSLRSIVLNLSLAALMGLILAAGLHHTPLRAAGPVCTVDSAGSADYTTIGAAVADVGCTTINVAAGVYTENITIKRDLTIQGAGADATIIDGNGELTHQRVITISHYPYPEVSIADVTIQNGYAVSPTHGGAGIANQSTLTLTNVILTRNVVSGTESDDIGGAISPGGVGGGKLVMENCIVSHNAARRGGGIFFNATMWITNTLIYDNNAGSAGGGINNYGAMTLTNVTLSDNHASSNGGGIINNGSAMLINSTVVGNQNNGIRNHEAITLTNTLLVHNDPGNCDGDFTSAGHNLDGDGTCSLSGSGDISGANPKIGSLQDNGGSSWTYALQTGSPAIDAGDDAGCPTIDQRGVLRPFDGDEDGTATCDIGAYEFNAVNRIYLPLIVRNN